jgi:hypothetical protein
MCSVASALGGPASENGTLRHGMESTGGAIAAGRVLELATLCSGQMPMQGTGELNFEGADSYTGAIQATSQGMNMTIKLAGKKVGTCDNPQ